MTEASKTTENIHFETDEQRASYGFGLQYGQQLARNRFDGLDLRLVMAGIDDVLARKKWQIGQAELNAAFESVHQKLQEEKNRRAAEIVEAGRAFLHENAKLEAVKVTPSGLQYEVIEEGTGKKPGPNALVKTHYHGTLIDGTVFDSSYRRDQPGHFGVAEVIKGWTEALQMMTEGSTWKIYLPAELGYGAEGSPPRIPGGSVLIFQIELIKVLI